MHPNQKSTFSFIVIGVFSPGLVGKGVIVGLAVVVVGPPVVVVGLAVVVVVPSPVVVVGSTPHPSGGSGH